MLDSVVINFKKYYKSNLFHFWVVCTLASTNTFLKNACYDWTTESDISLIEGEKYSVSLWEKIRHVILLRIILDH